LRVQKTKLDGVLLIEPPTIFEDFRGSYVELYNEPVYRAAGIEWSFIQDDISASRCHVLRGITAMNEPPSWSPVSTAPSIVVVNNVAGSPQYRQWEAFTLTEHNRHQVLIPPGFGNGHLVMSEMAIFHYKQSTIYDRASQFTLAWNDPQLGIWWPIDNPILSKRDQGGAT
jgi:dTDP-4-dehydrorhamnose 3,5-epimerase